MWRHEDDVVRLLVPVKKFKWQFAVFIFWKERTQKSASYDVVIDSLARSLRELWPKIGSNVTAVAFVVLKGFQVVSAVTSQFGSMLYLQDV